MLLNMTSPSLRSVNERVLTHQGKGGLVGGVVRVQAAVWLFGMQLGDFLLGHGLEVFLSLQVLKH